MIVFGFSFGGMFAAMTYYYTNEKVINGWFMCLLILITLGFLTMFVSGIILCKNGNEEVAKEKEKNKAYRNKEPYVMFERYNAV